MYGTRFGWGFGFVMLMVSTGIEQREEFWENCKILVSTLV